MTKRPLRLLLAEENDASSARILEALARQGHEPECVRVSKAGDFLVALDEGDFEIILCGYVMSEFDVFVALEILKATGKDIPLIAISGNFGEEIAVEAIRRGAADYLLKDNLTRLGAAVEREIGLAAERRKTAEKLHASETLLRIASNAAHIGGWTIDFPENRITWSDEVCAIHEVPPGTSPGIEQALDFYASEWRGKVATAFEKCLFEGAPFDDEMEIVTALGRRIWVRTIGEGIRDSAGVVTRIQGALQDITEKRRAKEEAERMALRLSTTLESLTDAFFTVDHDWRFTYMNAQAERMLGRTRQDLLGKVLWDEIPCPAEDGFGAACRRAMAEQVPVELVDFYVSRGRWFELHAHPSVEGLAVSFHDVTERLQSEEQLRILENCVSCINDIVIITEVRQPEEGGPRVLFVNDAFVRHMGYSRAEVLGISPRFLLGPRTQEDRIQLIREAVENGESIRTELINYKKNGEEICLEIEMVPVLDADGKLTHLVAVERDVTQRKAEEEANRADELRYLVQRNALIALTKSNANDSSAILTAFRQITETSAKTLNVARVSIWRFTEDRGALECMDLFQLDSNEHSSGMVLAAADYPVYFNGIACMEPITAVDAHTDPYTRDFSKNYLSPLGIGAMMDVPIHYKNSVNHVLCLEHVGSFRHWTDDEKTFSVAIGNLISLALESTERARVQHDFLMSHHRFQSVAAATDDTIWDWNIESDTFWWNDGLSRLFGWEESNSNQSTQVWIRQIHPEDRDRVVEGLDAVIANGENHWKDEYRFISREGKTSYVLDYGQVIRDASGKAVRMVGGMTDLTASKAAQWELDRSHRALRMLSSCNEMLIRATSEKALLQDACRIAVEIGRYRMAWVGYAMDDEKKTIFPLAHVGDESDYLSEVTLTWAGGHSPDSGPVGQAIRSGELVVVDDILENPSFDHWLEPAKKRGYRSVICLPLRDGTRVFGALCLYGTERHPEVADELKLLLDMANDLAFGIGNIRNREERQRTQEVVVKVAQAVSSGTGAEFFKLLTHNMVEALGAKCGLIGRHNANENSIETLSYVFEGRLEDNFRYDLDGTPCENVAEGEICVIEKDVQGLFPMDHVLVELGIESYAGIPLFHQSGQVAGIMMVMFSNPLEDTALVQSTLQIFAARAASELDRQQADARIREQASLLDKAQDAILVRNLDHKITFWNKSAERLYGWTAEEAVGRPVQELHFKDQAAFLKAHEQTLRLGEWVGEITQVDKSGRDLTIEGRWTLVRDANGEPESVFVINTDISEHRKLEQQFLRAQRLESIGTLAGGIAHDLNNILAPISMAAELLKMSVSDPRSAELLRTIASSAKRGADMVGQVLSFSRGMDSQRVEVHPRKLILEVEAILRDTFLKRIRLEAVAPRELWTIHGDQTQLHQVILNLCLNARDAIAGSGRISIRADNVIIDESFAAMNLEAKEGAHVCIQVEDSGAGIPPEILEKIFDPFFTTKSVGKGTGLGLSTSLAIVRSHGGFIRTVSQPGEGTTMKVYLPARQDLDDSVLAVNHSEQPRGHGEMVLIVDDEMSIRQITQQTLETFGYRTLLAENGDEAISEYALHQSEISVVLTDMMMPVMDGSATIELLMRINPSVRIIATSGITANRELAATAGAGVRDFLQKPYSAETLLKCLKRVLSEVD
ncbi:PAS domain S-box protein [Luteolibacter yonseiensis]|uniref:histidine kinase n=1 Tax=Luteolibacter yonseiensis TaxID=1144680 RepID=A0A934R0Y7_9BACT|nr:PAS domain S-box protein [Luteolibacter yonseiensis]MBK1814153.1 PAS domain S-box protein [Luteolibacter yonseiensis]